MFEHLDDELDVSPAPLEGVLQRGRTLRTRRRVVAGTTSVAVVAMIATASAALASTASDTEHVTATAPTTIPSTVARTDESTTALAPTASTAPTTAPRTVETLPRYGNPIPSGGILTPGNPEPPTTEVVPTLLGPDVLKWSIPSGYTVTINGNSATLDVTVTNPTSHPAYLPNPLSCLLGGSNMCPSHTVTIAPNSSQHQQWTLQASDYPTMQTYKVGGYWAVNIGSTGP